MANLPRQGAASALTAFCMLLACTTCVRAEDADTVATSGEPVAQVIVSARKREEPEIALPAAITTFTAEVLDDFAIRSFTDYAAMTPDLSFSYGGGPTGFTSARTVAIRGVTGQNLFGTAGATSLYIDDTPIPVSVDPRVLDIHDIEVLKGPQGTLYGEGALGGNVRLVLNRPNLAFNTLDLSANTGSTSGAGGANLGGSSIVNLVIIPGGLALRGVLFADHEAGYLARTYPDPTSAAVSDPFLAAARTRVGDQGAGTSLGGSLTLLWRASEQLDLQLRVLGEQQRFNGFPVAFAPLPQFRPRYTSDRAYDVQPRATDDWTLTALELTYRGTGWNLVSSTSFFNRHTLDVEDSTYGTEQVLTSVYQASSVPPQPFVWVGRHSDRQVTSETRLAFEPWHRLSGTLGFFYSNARASFQIPPIYASGLVAATANDPLTGPATSDLLWTQSDPGRQQDTSVFGELYYQILQPLTFTLGLRQYWLRQYADYTAAGYLNLGVTPSDPQHNTQSGLNPKYVLSYRPRESAEIYVSASKGFRAGGAQAYAPFCTLPDLPVEAISQIKSDTLWSFEAGMKLQLPDPNLLLTLAAYHIDWKNLQQQVALPCGAYFDLNGNAAEVSGAEGELVGHPLGGLELRLGLGYERTSLSEPGALADAGVLPGTRISGIPTWTATAGAAYHRHLRGDLAAFVAADCSYTGDSTSLLNGGNGAIATRPSYSMVNLRFGLQRPDSELSLSVRNLTNVRPNLGDIGYLGYAQRDPGDGVIPQVATLQPLTVTLEYRKSF